MKVLALGGSIRANPRSRESLLELVNASASFEDFLDRARYFSAERGENNKVVLTNTEICAAAGLLGAKENGAEIDYFTLSSLFSRRETPFLNRSAENLGLHSDIFYYDYLKVDEKSRAELIDSVKSADGVILASPVYFGDRSSVSNKFLQIASKEKILSGKVFGSVTAGAKRNGGQETTNMFHLNEVRQLGAFIVGNGPKTSQYGGTVVAGDIGSAHGDPWGLETCFGTGRRVSQVAKTLTLEQVNPLKRDVRIKILVTMDDGMRTLYGVLQKYVGMCAQDGVSFELVHLLDGEIDRCLACNICPVVDVLEDRSKYSCIIKTKRDGMDSLRETLLDADGIIIAGLNTKGIEDVLFRYQAFTERTRFIRRNDFELTNVPITSFVLEDAVSTTDSFFTLKVMVSYMRHNSIICPPLKEVVYSGETIMDARLDLLGFIESVKNITARRYSGEGIKVSYKAGGGGGYKDNRLDQTEAVRN